MFPNQGKRTPLPPTPASQSGIHGEVPRAATPPPRACRRRPHNPEAPSPEVRFPIRHACVRVEPDPGRGHRGHPEARRVGAGQGEAEAPGKQRAAVPPRRARRAAGRGWDELPPCGRRRVPVRAQRAVRRPSVPVLYQHTQAHLLQARQQRPLMIAAVTGHVSPTSISIF
jgi:hypothetical protein